jgi:hypothetical protein
VQVSQNVPAVRSRGDSFLSTVFILVMLITVKFIELCLATGHTLVHITQRFCGTQSVYKQYSIL